MNRFLSFSKRLSRRLLIVFVLTITIIAVCVIAFVANGVIKKTDAYYRSELKAANETIARILDKTDQDGFYQYMRRIDLDINQNILHENVNEKDDKDIWAYCVVIDSVGTYLYHPDRPRIGKGNLFDDIGQPDRKTAETDLASIQTGEDFITIDGVSSYIYYLRRDSANWGNAIIVPGKALLMSTNIPSLILLAIIALGLLLTYWISRHTIRCFIKPLQLLAKSADEVARGNFETQLPELEHHDEISQLRDSFSNMQQSLVTYIDQLKTATAEKAAIKKELNIARDIQMSMVPKVFPQHDNIDIYGSMTPAKAVGGDLFDFFIRDNLLFFCIGDVSGKGVPAALFMSETRSLFHAFTTSDSMPDHIVSQMNQVLNQNNDACMFVTLFVGILDLTSGQLRYCNGGHEAPILIGEEPQELSMIPSFPVGVIADSKYETQTVMIAPQTTILLYTDGLNEAMDADDHEFGIERINNEIKRTIQTGQLSPKALIEGMTQAVSNFVGDAEQSDDLTLMAIRRK